MSRRARAEAASSEPTRADLEFCALAAIECSRNAHALAVESQLLLDSGRFARAMALSIASLEEDAKHTFFMGQATDFDPEYRTSVRKRTHETMLHPNKQQRALKSLRNVFGPSPMDPYTKPDSPPSPIGHIDLDKIGSEIRIRREAGLYVEVQPDGIRSPLDEITEAEASEYVTLAAAAAWARRWVHGSEVAAIADYLQAYRKAYLRHAAPTDSEDLDQAVRAFHNIGEEVFASFEFVLDESQWPVAIRRSAQ